MEYPKPKDADLGDLVVRIQISTDRIVGRQNDLIDTEKKLVSAFEAALSEQKKASKWAAMASVAAFLTAVATFIVAWVTFQSH